MPRRSARGSRFRIEAGRCDIQSPGLLGFASSNRRGDPDYFGAQNPGKWPYPPANLPICLVSRTILFQLDELFAGSTVVADFNVGKVRCKSGAVAQR